jgi:2'-5' RNA ligase
LSSPPWRVGSFALFSSWTSSEGSRYDLEREYRLEHVRRKWTPVSPPDVL